MTTHIHQTKPSKVLFDDVQDDAVRRRMIAGYLVGAFQPDGGVGTVRADRDYTTPEQEPVEKAKPQGPVSALD